MRAHLIALTFFAAMAANAASAQTAVKPAAPPISTFTSSSDIDALIAKAKSELKDGQPRDGEAIFALPPYRVGLEYRVAPATAEFHETQAELIYVIDGSGTLVTGGTLANPKRTNATNISGTGIDGGASRPIAKGDFIFVPENTPHWVSAINAPALVLMSLHLPRPLPDPTSAPAPAPAQ